jgi:hypothetical protein
MRWKRSPLYAEVADSLTDALLARELWMRRRRCRRAARPGRRFGGRLRQGARGRSGDGEALDELEQLFTRTNVGPTSSA